MQIFYAPDIESGYYTLDENESKHSIRVLRMKKGTPVKLIDGKGNLYEGVVDDPDPVKCVISILSVIKNFENRGYRLHIAVSPLKNPERFEWFVEKSVEIGVDEITPVICRNTEKPGIKLERIRRIIISAMKQSLKAKLTILNETCRYEDFLMQEFEGTCMIACCDKDHKRDSIGEIYQKGSDAVMMIGPEGDFSGDEIEAAVARGFYPVHLGSSRLRTETAGIAACHSIYFINQ